MKKTAIIGIVVLIVMFVVTCDFFQPEDAVEYTDVVYSEDGSRVTLYLDGVGVPRTAAQRAMSTRLSKMAYDYLDVVFLSPAVTSGGADVEHSTVIARAQWELGQAAGISGVYRGPTTGTTANIGEAYGPTKSLLVAGLKNGKTLLGIGEIFEVDGSGTIASPNVTIKPDSRSVTFIVDAVRTGLLVEKETVHVENSPPATMNKYGIRFDSLDGTSWVGSSRTKLGSSYVPTYNLPAPTATTPKPETTKTYKFFGAPARYAGQINYASTDNDKKILIEPRFPRYMDNGRYRQLSATIDMMSTVVVDPVPTVATLVAAGTPASVDVGLKFTSVGAGIFSFYIEIPVYVLATGLVDPAVTPNDLGTNGGNLAPIKWRIRTGIGSELYSLDDGASGGGCVLMTIGTLSLEDWLEINWDWVNP